MQREIAFLITETRRTLVELQDRFQYRPERGYRWLQKAAIWILRNLGCSALDETVAYTRYAFHPDKFMDALVQQERELVDLYHREGRRLLIGPEDFSRLCGDPEVWQYFSFNTEYGYGRTIHGMKITVVPWMRGMLVVPKD